MNTVADWRLSWWCMLPVAVAQAAVVEVVRRSHECLASSSAARRKSTIGSEERGHGAARDERIKCDDKVARIINTVSKVASVTTVAAAYNCPAVLVQTGWFGAR